jgi:hypothetical protein
MSTVGQSAPTEANPRKSLRFRVKIPKIDPENPEAPPHVVVDYESVDDAIEYGVRVRGLDRERHQAEIMGLLGRLVGAGGSSSKEAPPPAAPPAPVPPSVSMPAERKWITQKEFAYRHSVSVSQVRKWCMHGLPTNSIKGRGVKIKVIEGDAWVESGGPELVRLRERGRKESP